MQVHPIRHPAAPRSTAPPHWAPCPCTRRRDTGHYMSGIHRARRVWMKSSASFLASHTISLPVSFRAVPFRLEPIPSISSTHSLCLTSSVPIPPPSPFLRPLEFLRFELLWILTISHFFYIHFLCSTCGGAPIPIKFIQLASLNASCPASTLALSVN
jgi:hypothetical protein